MGVLRPQLLYPDKNWQRAYEPSRLFDDAANNYLYLSQAVVSSAPVTMVAWVRPDDVQWQSVLQVSDVSWWESFDLWLLNGGEVLAQTMDNGVASFSTTVTTYSQNTWHHVGAVFASPTSRVAYLDGKAATPETTSRVPENLDTTLVGIRRTTAGKSIHFSGRVMWPTIWAGALSADEMAALSNRRRLIFPWEIRPESIVSMPNLRTLYDPVAKTHWTAEGTKLAPAGALLTPAAQARHPRHVSMYLPLPAPSGPAAAPLGALDVGAIQRDKLGRPAADAGGLQHTWAGAPSLMPAVDADTPEGRRVKLAWHTGVEGSLVLPLPRLLNGVLLSVVFGHDDPDVDGSIYDVRLYDALNRDMLLGAGEGLDFGTVQRESLVIPVGDPVRAYLPVLVFGQYYLSINTGADDTYGSVTFLVTRTYAERYVKGWVNA